MPKGSDTLIPIENVEVIDNKIKIIKKFQMDLLLEQIGENYKK